MKKVSMFLIIALSLTLVSFATFTYADGEDGIGQYCNYMPDGNFIERLVFYFLYAGEHDVCVAAQNNGNNDPVAICKVLKAYGLDIPLGQCVSALRH